MKLDFMVEVPSRFRIRLERWLPISARLGMRASGPCLTSNGPKIVKGPDRSVGPTIRAFRLSRYNEKLMILSTPHASDLIKL